MHTALTNWTRMNGGSKLCDPRYVSRQFYDPTQSDTPPEATRAPVAGLPP